MIKILKALIKKYRVKRLVKKINKALNIKLSDWQISYIFYSGEYHDELNYGRQNGKTTANILKLLLETPLSFPKYNPMIYDTITHRFDCDLFIKHFAMEDAKTLMRLQYFQREPLRIKEELNAIGIRTVNIVFRRENYD